MMEIDIPWGKIFWGIVILAITWKGIVSVVLVALAIIAYTVVAIGFAIANAIWYVFYSSKELLEEEEKHIGKVRSFSAVLKRFGIDFSYYALPSLLDDVEFRYGHLCSIMEFGEIKGFSSKEEITEVYDSIKDGKLEIENSKRALDFNKSLTIWHLVGDGFNVGFEAGNDLIKATEKIWESG